MYHKTQKNASLQHIMKFVRQKTKHKVQRTIISILFTCLFIFSFAATAKADWSTDITNNTPVCTLLGDQWLQDTKSDGHGGVWITYLHNTKDYDYLVMLQHYNSTGVPTFQTNGIIISVTATWHKVVILGCSSNYVDICYGGYFNYENRIYSKRINLSGNVLWSNTVFEPLIDSHAICSAPVMDGYIIATARKYDESYITNDIFAQKILFDGTVAWGTTGKFVAAMADTASPILLRSGFDAVVIDETNVFIVWLGKFNYQANRVQAQGITSNGKLWWSKKKFMGDFSTDVDDEYGMCASLVYSNNILIAWWEYTSGLSSNTILQTQLIGRNGEKKYPENGLTIVDVPYFDGWKLFVETYKNKSKALFVYNIVENSTNGIYCQSLDLVSKTISDFPTGKIVNTENTPQILSPVVTSSDKEVFLPWKQNGEIIYQLFDENVELLDNPRKISLTVGQLDVSKSFVLNEKDIIIFWGDNQNGNWDIFAQIIDAEIPEPVLFSVLFSLFILMLLGRNKLKIFSIVFLFIFTSMSFARYGVNSEPSKGWAHDGEKKGRDWNPSNANPDDFCVHSFYSQKLRLEGGKVGSLKYLGLYNKCHFTDSKMPFMELCYDYIEFGGMRILFNDMYLQEIRTPLITETDHAANVQFVLDCMNGATNSLASRSWATMRFYPREDVDSMTNSVVSWVKDNYYQKSELYTLDEIDNSFYNKTHINTNFYSVPDLYNHFNTNVYDKQEADNRFISITVATNISEYISGQAITNLLDNGCAFKGPVYLDNNGGVSPMLQWRNPDDVNETHAYLDSSKWRLENILNPLAPQPEKTVIELNSIDTEPSHIAFFVSNLTTPILKIVTNEVNLNTVLNLNQNRITGLEPAQNADEPLTLGQWDSSNQIVNLMFYGLSSTVANHAARIYSLETNIIELSKLQLILTNGSEAITNYLVTEITLDVLASELTNAMVLGDGMVKNWALAEFYKKTTIDNALAEKLNVTGGDLTGNIDLNDNNILGVNVLRANEVQINNNLKFNGGASYSKIKVNDKDLISLNSGAGGENVYLHGNSFALGNMTVSGNLSVNGYVSKQAGTFEIDHPLDRENKILRHSFVESPDMMNIYNGNIILDKNGGTVIKLPDYFEALNKDFRYSLTPIGGAAPNLHIKSEIRNLKFEIGGGNPGQKVSWTVTGIRQDVYAKDNRIIVEEKKKKPGLIYNVGQAASLP